MRGGPAPFRKTFLLLGLTCLCAAAARAQSEAGWPSAGSPNPQAGTTRKLDEYGKIGHCDETARLDNFAIELQNEPGANGYLLVYVGRHDLPSWTPGILGRASSYLVHSRGIDPGRVKVIDGGYREERTTELWVVPAHAPPPQPSDTINFKLDRTKAYQWDEDSFEIVFTPDETADAESEDTDSEEAEGEAVAADAQEAEAESAEEARAREETEKYSIKVVTRGVFEEEPEPEGHRASAAKPGEEAAAEATADATAEAADAAADDPPMVGEITVNFWWNVEKLTDELKAVPEARVCLVYYWGVKSATQERVQEIIGRAVTKTGEQLGLKRDRIVVIDGGRRTQPGVELWVVPPGAELPRPTPEQTRKFGFYTMPGEE